MLFSRKTSNTPADQGKELQKLKRQDLLELLVDQMRENDQLRATQSEQDAELAELAGQLERLKRRLDEKDAQLAHLKAKLDQKDQLLADVHARAQEIAQAKGPGNRMALLQQAEALLAEHYLQAATAQAATAQSKTAPAPKHAAPDAEATE